MSDAESSTEGLTARAEPEAFRARALIVSLTVDDLQESVTWYRDVVGFTVEREIEREGKVIGVVVVAGSVRMILNQDDGARGWDRNKAEGFSLTLGTAQSVDELAARVVERGGTLEMEPTDMPWGARIFRLVDPSGFRLSISSV